MEAVRDGSARALQEIMDRLWPELVRFAAWELRDTDGARDVVQEAFIHLWSERRSWVRSGSPRAYLYKIVRHKTVDEQRRRKVRKAWVEQQTLRPRRGPATPAETLEAARVREVFARAMASLSDARREAFNLVVMRGLSHREAAEVRGVSPQTVANQVSAALRRLHKALREHRENGP